MTDTLRALTLSPLWAWAMVRLGKDVENRVRRWAYRGPVLIHSAKTCTRAKWEADRLAIEAIIGRRLTEAELAEARYLAGQIVAIVEIVDCVAHCPEVCEHAPGTCDMGTCEPRDGSWFIGPYGYKLDHTQPLTPTPYTGGLGLRKFDHFSTKVATLVEIDSWMAASGYSSERDYDTGHMTWVREARP